MTETYIVVLLWITTLGLFVVYNKFHKHLNKTWGKNMQYSLNGNDGKGLSLMRINGIGFSFYGKYREALVGDYKTYVTYHVFCLFFIPILPLGCFRVIKENGGYRILGGERMAWREILCMFLGLIKWPFAIFAILRLLVLCLK